MQKEKISKPLLMDIAVKKIFTAPRCQNYLFHIISAATNIPIEDVKNDFKLLPNEISVNNNIKNSQTDIVSENKNHYINIEINYNKSKANDNKNITYIGQLMLRQTKIGSDNDYKNMKQIIQINIDNYDLFEKNEFIYYSNIREKKYNLKRSDLIEIVDINIDYLSKISYNTIEEEKENSLKKLLYIFVCDDEDILNEIYEGDEIMAKVREEINDLTHELDKYLYYDQDALDRAYKEELSEEIEKELKKQITEKVTADVTKKVTEDVTKKVTADVTKKVTADVTKKVMKQGIEQGIAMEKNNIVKKLLDQKNSFEYISELTGLSIDEITEIKRGL